MKKVTFVSNFFKFYFFGILLSTFLISCGDDDIDPSKSTDWGSLINKSYDVTYTVKVADANTLRDIADLEIQYFDAEGTLHIDTINQTTWSKQCYYEMNVGTKIGLKARWILHDKAQLEELMQQESNKPLSNRNTYSFDLDITSPYVSVKTDDTEVESIFASTRYIGISSKQMTVEAIVAGMLNTTHTADFYHEVVEKAQGVKLLEEGVFPTFDKEYNVTYTVKIVDSRVINDLADLEISYIDNEGNTHKQLINQKMTYQNSYAFKSSGNIIGLSARWQLRDRAVLDAVVANEMKKKESDRINYDFSLDITSPCSIVQTNGSTRDEQLKETNKKGISGMTYKANEVVEKLIGEPMFTEFVYQLSKENNNMNIVVSSRSLNN